MCNIERLVKVKDGKALKALAMDGSHEAGLGFAELVFMANYPGDLEAVNTKKEAKEIARLDAFSFVETASDSGDVKAMIRLADVKYFGVREPGPHGSTLSSALYGESEVLYRNLLEHTDCPQDRRGEFLIKQAQSIALKSRIKGIDRQKEVVELLEAALTAEDKRELAHHILC